MFTNRSLIPSLYPQSSSSPFMNHTRRTSPIISPPHKDTHSPSSNKYSPSKSPSESPHYREEIHTPLFERVESKRKLKRPVSASLPKTKNISDLYDVKEYL